MQCGAVRKKLVGRANRIQIANRVAFDRFLKSRFPLGIDTELNDVFDRAGAIIAFGDAKAVRQGAEEGIFVRSVRPGVKIRCDDGEIVVPVGKLSSDAGGAALSLTIGRIWTFSGSVAVIENAETFWRYEKVLPEVDLAVYASGSMSGRLLAWLGSPAMASCLFMHWGDYDPRGVEEYLRLLEACPDRVDSFVPKNIEALMKYGNRKLWLKQSKHLERLRKQSVNPHVRLMLDLFDKHRVCLEQEVLLAEALR